jgi:hypothetical protein
MAKGTNTTRVMTSCRIFSCARVMPAAKPIAVCGHLQQVLEERDAPAHERATYHGLACRCFRWPYQANVMKRFESASSVAVARASAGGHGRSARIASGKREF